MSENLPADPAFTEYHNTRRAHWEKIANKAKSFHGGGGAYHRRLEQIYRFLIPPGERVLEIGCGMGDLLSSLQPAYGVGVDFSGEMLTLARQRHPGLTFLEVDAHELCNALDERFDVIILSDTVNDLWDVQRVLQEARKLSHPGTRVILNFYSRLWELPLSIAKNLGLATRTLYQNWLTVDDTQNLLHLAGFEVIRSWPEVLLPLPIPLLAAFANQFLIRLWPFEALCLANFLIARPAPEPARNAAPLVSVIIPARNEAGNIPQVFRRTPQMGAGTELVFVEGHSQDDTYEAIEREMAANPEWRCKLFRQTGTGKGDAVRLGFAEASGEILMILDADLTVPPEDLPRFYDALASGTGEFINGVRLVYPMEKEAMRFFNFLGNKFFSVAFTWLLGQPVKDTLCGTKVLWKADYERIAANRTYFGEIDPFGDFDLLFGAAKLSRKIVDLPIRYRERTYGTTNIQRWKHGWLLLRMVALAARRLKFI